MTPQAVAVPRGTYEGRPFAVLIQIFPDGRCGFAIDGTPVAVGPPGYLAPTARVRLESNSSATRIVVGRVRVGAGVASAPWGGASGRGVVAEATVRH